MSWTVQKINTFWTHLTPGGTGVGGGALGVKISKVREISRTAEKIDKKCNPHPTPPTPRGGGVTGENFKASSFKKYLGNAVILGEAG